MKQVVIGMVLVNPEVVMTRKRKNVCLAGRQTHLEVGKPEESGESRQWFPSMYRLPHVPNSVENTHQVFIDRPTRYCLSDRLEI